MKKIISLTIFLILLVSAYGQCNQPYKALLAFANDTTAFMIYNFADRELCYKGKTVNDVLSDLESSKVTIKSYSYRVKRDRNTKGISMVTSITLYLYDGKLVSKKLDKRLEGNYDQLNSLTIFLETPIEFKSIHSLLSNNKNGSWKTEIRDFFATKRISEVRFSE